MTADHGPEGTEKLERSQALIDEAKNAAHDALPGSAGDEQAEGRAEREHPQTDEEVGPDEGL